MGMPRRRKGARALGPYENGDGWRVREVAADGSATWSPTFASEREADIYKESLEQTIVCGELTVWSGLEEYEKFLDRKGNKKDSKRQTLWALRQFFSEDVPFWAIREGYCEKRYKALTEQFSVASHRGMLAQAKTFLNWCVSQKWLKENPCKAKGLGRRNRRKVQLSSNEAKAWFSTAYTLAEGDDDGAMSALVAMLMGLRASEIVGIKIRDLDETDQPCDSLWIRESKTETGERHLEVPSVLVPLFQKLSAGRAGDRWLFETSKGKDGRHWRDWPNLQVKRICELSKVPQVTCHGMRGFVATLSLRKGQEDVSAYLGHNDTRTTDDHYALPGAREQGLRKRGIEVLLRKKTILAQDADTSEVSDGLGKPLRATNENN